MQKLVRTSMSYMIIGLFFGLYYREFTKYFEFSGKTQLAVLHTHTLILGMFFFLIVLLLEKNFQLMAHKKFKTFYFLYNAGVGLTLLMLLIHGTMTVLGYADHAAIAGIAGIGHILLTVGLFYFFKILSDRVKSS